MQISAKQFVIATGSHADIPSITGLEDINYLTNETVFDLDKQPEHLIVIGGGPIGCELAQAHRLLGTPVTLLQRSTLLPKEDPDIVNIMKERFHEDGLVFYENIQIEQAEQTGNSITISFKKR